MYNTSRLSIGFHRPSSHRIFLGSRSGHSPKKLHALGIHNGTQLQACTLEMLTRQFGKAGNLYYDFARGIDLRPVEPIRIRKSVGCEHTLEKDISLHSSAIIELYHVVTELLERLKRTNFSGNTLTLKSKIP